MTSIAKNLTFKYNNKIHYSFLWKRNLKTKEASSASSNHHCYRNVFVYVFHIAFTVSLKPFTLLQTPNTLNGFGPWTIDDVFSTNAPKIVVHGCGAA